MACRFRRIGVKPFCQLRDLQLGEHKVKAVVKCNNEVDICLRKITIYCDFARKRYKRVCISLLCLQWCYVFVALSSVCNYYSSIIRDDSINDQSSIINILFNNRRINSEDKLPKLIPNVVYVYLIYVLLCYYTNREDSKRCLKCTEKCNILIQYQY